ncbi:hypothetical protein FSP39_011970 [Pinctada imbricata]|uniref:Uncharacterized protein n=1 Tax=Pinctada imbricata TaxID=66713 RepID=A0AA89BNE9_PINIB|nr:hypothetical protein FSP39_011970 [Pinctada imbricata]
MMISFSSGNNIIIFFIDLFESKGIQRDTGVWLYTALGLASTLIRPFPGYLAQLPRVPKLAIPAVHILIGAVAIILFPYATSVTHFAALSCSFGMSIGGLVSVLSISTLHIVGEDDYPTALGVLMSSIGIMTSVAGPMSGYQNDQLSEMSPLKTKFYLNIETYRLNICESCKFFYINQRKGGDLQQDPAAASTVKHPMQKHKRRVQHETEKRHTTCKHLTQKTTHKPTRPMGNRCRLWTAICHASSKWCGYP